MKEFVYLPNKGQSPHSSFDTLAQAMSGSARVVMSKTAAQPRRAGFSDASLEAANISIGRLAEAAPEDAMEVEMVDFVERTGAVLLNALEIPDAATFPSGALVPVVYYQPAIAEVRVGRSKVQINSGPAATSFLTINLQFSDDHRPVVGAVANLRLVGQPEISAVSDSNGVVTFGLRAQSVNGARLMVEPGFAGHWGYLMTNAAFSSGDTFEVDKIDLSNTPDGLRHMITPGGPADGSGVRVAVVDSGVGPHPDLVNSVGDLDSSIGHGSHVAGIIGGQGTNGLGGIAPGVDMLSYRVFDDPSTGVARNFEIHRAIEQAVADDCHLINLSLKSEFRLAPAMNDPVISRALEDAAEAGVVCIAAAGNDFRRFVAFPARHPDALAVSAAGWQPGIPATAYDNWTVTDDRSSDDPDLFFSNFSNEGVDDTDVDLIGPGAAIISTVPGDTYAPMSGTSMACPAIVGAVARLLSSNPTILAMPGDQARTDAMRQLIDAHATTSGFSEIRQGKGTLS